MKYIKSQFQKFSGLQKIYTKATLIINLLKHVKGSLEKITALLSKNLDYNWQNNKLEIRGNGTTCLRCWEWGEAYLGFCTQWKYPWNVKAKWRHFQINKIRRVFASRPREFFRQKENNPVWKQKCRKEWRALERIYLWININGRWLYRTAVCCGVLKYTELK